MTDYATYVDQWGRALQVQNDAMLAAAQVPGLVLGAGAVMQNDLAATLQTVFLPEPTTPEAIAPPVKIAALPAPDALLAPEKKALPKAAAKAAAKPAAKKPAAKPATPKPATAKAAAPKTAAPKAPVPKAAEPKTPAPKPAKAAPKAKAAALAAQPEAAPRDVVSVTPAGAKKPVSLAAMPEPAPSKAKPAPSKAKTAPKAAPAETAKPDDLTVIKGVGPKLAKVLNEKGITTYAQIAAWTPKELAAFDAQLGTFQGRAKRGNWVAKAQAILDGKPQP